jgi:hypothetical protein
MIETYGINWHEARRISAAVARGGQYYVEGRPASVQDIYREAWRRIPDLKAYHEARKRHERRLYEIPARMPHHTSHDRAARVCVARFIEALDGTGMSRKAFARELGVSASTPQYIIANGQCSAEMRERFAKGFGVSVAWLAGEEL